MNFGNAVPALEEPDPEGHIPYDSIYKNVQMGKIQRRKADQWLSAQRRGGWRGTANGDGVSCGGGGKVMKML